MEYQDISPKKDWVNQLNYNLSDWHEAQTINGAVVILNGFSGVVNLRTIKLAKHTSLVSLDWRVHGTASGLTDMFRIPKEYQPNAWTYGIGSTTIGQTDMEWVLQTDDQGAVFKVWAHNDNQDHQALGQIVYLITDN